MVKKFSIGKNIKHFADRHLIIDEPKNRSIMSKVKNNQVCSIPRWQSNKMRMILADRWQEVWEVVETRAKNNGDLLSYKGSWWHK